MSHIDRVILVVLDSVGIGELPDAGRYGDEGSDTLGNICRQVDLHVPNLQALGLGNIRPLSGRAAGAGAGGLRSAGWPRPRPARTR